MRSGRQGRTVAAAVSVVALLLGVASVDAALRAPGFALAGESVLRLALGVIAGWALTGAGLALAAVLEQRSGWLVAATGCAWVAAGSGTPGARADALFTLGLLCVAAAPALLGYALLVAVAEFPLPRLDHIVAVTLVATLVGLVGVLPSLAHDPGAASCGNCPGNLLALGDSAPTAAHLTRIGARLGPVTIAVVVAFVLCRLARTPAARRMRATTILVPGCAFLALCAVTLGNAWSDGVLGNDRVEQDLWLAQAVALLGVVAGVGFLLAAARRRRARLARLVLELADAQRDGGLRAALAGLLGDPELMLLFASRADAAWLDASGRPCTPPPDLVTTTLERDSRPVALICHRRGLLDDVRQRAELERGVGLALEHERLRSELRRRLADLQRSRADVAAAGEAERRMLERDLHDGAQQRLVAFAFALGIARRHAGPETGAAMERGQLEVQAALAELREVAHGLYPVALAEAGLAAAVESLGDRRAGLLPQALPSERFASAIEEATYFAIATLADLWSPAPVFLSAGRDGNLLVVDLHATAGLPTQLVDVEDRVGALGGTVSVDEPSDGTAHVRVEIPCG